MGGSRAGREDKQWPEHKACLEFVPGAAIQRSRPESNSEIFILGHLSCKPNPTENGETGMKAGGRKALGKLLQSILELIGAEDWGRCPRTGSRSEDWRGIKVGNWWGLVIGG